MTLIVKISPRHAIEKSIKALPVANRGYTVTQMIRFLNRSQNEEAKRILSTCFDKLKAKEINKWEFRVRIRALMKKHYKQYITAKALEGVEI
jgi:hypothetical protein